MEQELVETLDEHLTYLTEIQLRDYIGQIYLVVDSSEHIDSENIDINLTRTNVGIRVTPRIRKDTADVANLTPKTVTEGVKRTGSEIGISPTTSVIENEEATVEFKPYVISKHQ